jgi:hypothetical protein
MVLDLDPAAYLWLWIGNGCFVAKRSKEQLKIIICESGALVLMHSAGLEAQSQDYRISVASSEVNSTKEFGASANNCKNTETLPSAFAWRLLQQLVSSILTTGLFSFL